MESELERYRRRKRAAERQEELTKRWRSMWEGFWVRVCHTLLPSHLTSPNNDEQGEEQTDQDIIGDQEEVPPTISPTFRYLLWGVLLVSWLCVYVAFIKIGFGAVFFSLSLLLFLFCNTRGGGSGGGGRSRRGREVSAYSVFNTHCQPIQGTLDAQQLEKQLLYRNN